MRRWLPLLLVLLLGCHRRAEPLIFIGLDGADWQLLDLYMHDGLMPNLAKLVARGERRVLLTQHPPLSPLVWTSMMTGVSPLEHRILDFARFNPTTHKLEPITSDERAVPSIWNMATSGGKRVDVFGMWATYPAEKVNGTIITDRDVTSDTVHEVAIDRIRKDKPDLAIVYFEGTDAIGHLHPDRNLPIVKSYFADIDRKLGEYASLDANLLIASDHGFRWFDPPNVSSTAPGTAAKWHREEGIYLYVPRDPRSAVRDPPIHAVDVCSKILELIGVPRGDYRRRRVVAGSQPAMRAESTPPHADEQIAKLRALGYISGGGANATSTRTAASYDNEGLILGEQGRFDEAQKAFESALTVDPQSSSARSNFSDLVLHRAASSKEPIALLTRAIFVSDAPELHLYRGRYELQAQDCRAALSDFEKAPENAIKYASVGTASMCLGDRAAATAAFNRSLRIDPNQPPLRAFLRKP